MNFKFVATCPVSFEEPLAKEIAAAGISEYEIQRGAVEFDSPWENVFKVLLNTRIASRLLFYFGESHCRDEKDLYSYALKANWEKYFSLNETIKIKVIFDSNLDHRRELFKNSLFVAQKFKDGICDFFNNRHKKRPSVDIKDPDVNIIVRITEDEDRFRCQIYLDLSPRPLFQRGYRLKGFEAPMKENLAAGILSYMNYSHESSQFIDCMCGSGTMLIEAALIRLGLPPAYLKQNNTFDFKFLKWKLFRENANLKQSWDQIYKEMQLTIKECFAKAKEKKEVLVFGYDENPHAVEHANDNIERAQLKHYIKVTRGNATRLSPPNENKSIIFCNPPYGKRMGEDLEELEQLYRDVGENFKHNFKGHTAYVFTGNPDMRKMISLKTSARIKMHNGPIECRLLKYDLF